jgi:hypothetical protein
VAVRHINDILGNRLERHEHVDVLCLKRNEYQFHTDLKRGEKLVARFFGYTDDLGDNGSAHAKMLSDVLKKQYRDIAKMLAYVPLYEKPPPPKVYTQDQNADRILKAL